MEKEGFGACSNEPGLARGQDNETRLSGGGSLALCRNPSFFTAM
jgi:hypothetical protein